MRVGRVEGVGLVFSLHVCGSAAAMLDDGIDGRRSVQESRLDKGEASVRSCLSLVEQRAGRESQEAKGWYGIPLR